MKKDSNVEFVKAMGSPSGTKEGPQPKGLYGPLPEDDWLYRMQHADADESAMGWLHAHTIDLDHHSLYAKDEHGKAVGPKQLAAYKGWGIGFTESVLLRLEKAGRIRRDMPWDQPSNGRKGRGKIFICGYVPAAHEEHNPGVDAKKKGLCTKSLLDKSYIKKQLETLPPENLKALLSWDKHFESFRPKVLADSVAVTRGILDEIQYKGFETFGVKLKRLKKKAKPAALLSVSLLDLPDSVQSPLPTDFVHTAIYGLHTGNKLSVQTDESGVAVGVKGTENQEVPGNGKRRAVLDSDKDKDIYPPPPNSLGTTAAAIPSSLSPTEREKDWVREALEQYCGDVDDRAIADLTKASREKAPDIEVGEICECIHELGAQAKRKDNPIGFALRAVPNRIDARWLAKHRAKKHRAGGRAECTCGTFPHAKGCAKFAVARGATGGE